MSKNIEITIPTELREITLSKYLGLLDFMANESDDIEISIRLIALMCDLSKDEVRALQIDDFNFIVEQLTETMNKKTNYVKPPNFKLGEVEYGFIPNLDEMTFGEYIDLDTFIKNDKDMHKAMTVLYRPIVNQSFGRYNIADYTGKEDYDIMLDAPMDAVKTAMVFFYTLGKELLRIMTNSLQAGENKDTVSKLTSALNGDGINQSMELLTETLESSMKPRVFQFIKR